MKDDDVIVACAFNTFALVILLCIGMVVVITADVLDDVETQKTIEYKHGYHNGFAENNSTEYLQCYEYYRDVDSSISFEYDDAKFCYSIGYVEGYQDYKAMD